MDSAIWEEVRYCHKISPIDPVLNLDPYSLGDYLIYALYDPFYNCMLSKSMVQELKDTGFTDEDIPVKDTHIFENSWLGTKICRLVFTNNTYVLASKSMMNNAIGVLPVDINAIKHVKAMAERLKLCCVIYSRKPMFGFERVNINSEEEDFDVHFRKANHIQLRHVSFKPVSKFLVFRDWYVDSYKYDVKTTIIDSIKWMKSLLQWSWLKFLVPICANFNVTNQNELMTELIRNIEKLIKVKVSLKFILNAAKCHPIQIAGHSTILAFGQKIEGNEIPFRNFRYVYSNSIAQWTQETINPFMELLVAYSYENDWIVNEEQRNFLQVLMYCKWEELEKNGFPLNLRTCWNANQERILYRMLDLDPRKEKWIQPGLFFMEEIT